MLAVAGQRLGERGGGDVRLFRFFCVDDGDQKILELLKQLLEHLGPLPPRQARCEHLVGVRRDAKMTSRVPPGENHQDYACQDHGESVAPAKIDQADEQGRKCHKNPRRCRMRRSMGGRLGLYRKISLSGQPPPVGYAQVIVRPRRQGYCKMPPDNSAVFCRKLTSTPAPPPSASRERISERCEATR